MADPSREMPKQLESRELDRAQGGALAEEDAMIYAIKAGPGNRDGFKPPLDSGKGS